MSNYIEVFRKMVEGVNTMEGLTDEDRSSILSTFMYQVDTDAKEVRKIIKASEHYKGRYSFKKGEYIK